MSTPDMRLPIQLALGFPDRLPAGIQGLDLAKLGRLTFEDLNREAFPSVGLAYSAGEQGSTFPAVLNAANEVAVMAFLEGKIRLTAIPEIVACRLAFAPCITQRDLMFGNRDQYLGIIAKEFTDL